MGGWLVGWPVGLLAGWLAGWKVAGWEVVAGVASWVAHGLTGLGVIGWLASVVAGWAAECVAG